MSDKVVAGLVTAAVVAPICAVCIGGPVFLASAAAGIGGWFSGLGAGASTGLAIIAAFVVVALVKRRKRKAADAATVTRDGTSSLKTTNWDKRSQTE